MFIALTCTCSSSLTVANEGEINLSLGDVRQLGYTHLGTIPLFFFHFGMKCAGCVCVELADNASHKKCFCQVCREC